jgi:hypothetical protein
MRQLIEVRSASNPGELLGWLPWTPPNPFVSFSWAEKSGNGFGPDSVKIRRLDVEVRTVCFHGGLERDAYCVDDAQLELLHKCREFVAAPASAP